MVAVVLNWNNVADTLECVDSVGRSDYPNLVVRVVDNGSRIDPRPVLHQRYPDLKILRNSENLGYGGGHNVGLRSAIDEGAAYIFLLNNDVVLAPDCISHLVAAAEAQCRIGMATPKVFYYDRPTDVYWDGGIIDWASGNVPHDSHSLPREGDIVRSEWLNGCALLVRVAAIRDIGFLDERYFLYFEDADWSVRAARRDWTNAVVLRAHAFHKVHRSTRGFANPAVRFYYIRNRYLFAIAHGQVCRRLSWKLRYISKMGQEYVEVRHDRESRRAVLFAYVSLLKGRWGAYETTGIGWRVVSALDRLLELVILGARALRRLIRHNGNTRRIRRG